MFYFLKFILDVNFNLQKSKIDLLIQITVLQKEVEVLKGSKGQMHIRTKKVNFDDYNSNHPHQAIEQRLPIGFKPQLHVIVKKIRILYGLCNHYMRSAV